MNRIEVNLKNGKKTTVELTQAEMDEASDRTAAEVPSKQDRINKSERKITMRNLRNAILGDTVAIAKLRKIEDEIKAIR